MAPTSPNLKLIMPASLSEIIDLHPDLHEITIKIITEQNPQSFSKFPQTSNSSIYETKKSLNGLTLPPELLQCIFQYLSQNHLFQCLQVSQFWFEFGLRHMYRSIYLDYRKSNPTLVLLRLAFIGNKYGWDMIKLLTLNQFYQTTEYWDHVILAWIISHCSKLIHLESNNGRWNTSYAEAIVSLPHLQSLNITNDYGLDDINIQCM